MSHTHSSAQPLHQQACAHQSGSPVSRQEQALLMSQLHGWSLDEDVAGGALSKTWSFPNFHRTMAFVNAVAWVAHTQDHHPDMSVSHGRCTLRWSTHSVGGLSLNDFICAARVDALSS